MRRFSANKDIEFWLTQAKKLIFRILEYMHAKLRKNMKNVCLYQFWTKLKNLKNPYLLTWKGWKLERG